MIAYDKQGAVFVLREGAEVLAHDGPSEGPLWRTTLDGTIVGLGANGTEVVAVTRTGTVTWLGARDGQVRSTAKLEGVGDGVTTALIDMTSKRIVAVTTDKILALATGRQVTLADHGARAIAARPDGTLLVATAAGELMTIGADGTRTAAPHSNGPIHAVAWHPSGFWVIGTAARLTRWSGTGEPSHLTGLPKDSQLDFVTCSERAIAVAFDGNQVVTIAWPSKETLASVEYLERKSEGIDFGPWPWLGISLDLGDGNKQNLADPMRLHRSDTHPGREHHSWLVQVGGGPDKAAAPAAKAAPPVVVPSGPATSTRVLAFLAAIVITILAFYLMRR